MKRLRIILIALLCVGMLSGCAVAQVLSQMQEDEAQSELSSALADRLREVQPSAPPSEPPAISSGASASSSEPSASSTSSSQAQPRPQVEESPELVFLAKSGAEDMLGWTFADILDAHGECKLTFNYSTGFYCVPESGDITYLLGIPKHEDAPGFMGYNELEYNFLFYDSPGYAGYGDPYIDFSGGDEAPADFMVTSVSLYGETLSGLFEPDGVVTYDRIAQVFGESGPHLHGDDESGKYLTAGPYTVGEYEMMFFLETDEIAYNAFQCYQRQKRKQNASGYGDNSE